MSDIRSLIPVVDIDKIGLHRKSEQVDKEALEAVSAQLKTTFCQFGVCYFKNHGIDEEFMDRYMARSKIFFNRSLEEKSQYLRGTRRDFGYTPMEKETVNFDRPADFKEAFTYHPADDPDDLIDKDFQQACKEMYAHCTTLGYRVLDALSLALGQRQNVLRDFHKQIATENNGTTLKTLYYPLPPAENAIKPGQIRLGEHSDYGTITFLFQDDVGGLDVKLPGKGFIHAAPKPRTIVVLAADMLQRWTADAVVSVQHRVLMPMKTLEKCKPRQSTVYFIAPDDECVVESLDGSKKYEPISFKAYIIPRLKATVGVTY